MSLTSLIKARDLFGSLQPEEEQIPDRIPEIKSNPDLEYLIREYEEFMEKATDFFVSEKLYEELKLDTEHLSSKNIEQFSLVLGKYQQLENFYISGIYLSNLINYSKDEEFTIHTNHIDYLIEDIGYKNTKNITVNGNAGSFIGRKMQGGIITVNGDTGYYVGYQMQNGIITINGNAGDFVGYHMKGGIITINENAGNFVGNSMQDGIINLN